MLTRSVQLVVKRFSDEDLVDYIWYNVAMCMTDIYVPFLEFGEQNELGNVASILLCYIVNLFSILNPGKRKFFSNIRRNT